MSDSDFDVKVFARLLKKLPEHPPITDAMEKRNGSGSGKCWYSSQREHMVGWFRAQATTGSGSYSRLVPNRSAKTAYNRIQCPPALIWMAEALGADPVLLQSVVDETLTVNSRSQCAFIRKHIPWEHIAELAKSHLDSQRGIKTLPKNILRILKMRKRSD